jgi:hypothetical protein
VGGFQRRINRFVVFVYWCLAVLAQSLEKDSLAKTLGAVVVAALAGYVCMREEGAAYLMLAFFFALGQIRNRTLIFFVTLFYLLGISSGLESAVSEFFQAGEIAGVIVWICYCVPVAAVLAITVNRSPHTTRNVIANTVWLFLLALPPFGVVFAGHPLFAGGDLYPGGGFISAVASTVLCGALAALRIDSNQDGSEPAWALMVGLLVMSITLRVASDFKGLPTPSEHIVALSTNYGMPNDSVSLDYEQLGKLTVGIRDGSPAPRTTIILPESVSLPATDAKLNWWRTELNNFFIDGGLIVVGESSMKTGKSAAVISAKAYDWLPARQTTPLSEWQPGVGLISVLKGGTPARENFYEAFGLHRSIVTDNRGDEISITQCYEALVPWLALRALTANPDVVVLQSNQWWARDKRIPRTLTAHARAIANMHGVAYLEAINR